MNIGPYGCHNRDKEVKAGKNQSGSQKYLCKACGGGYTPEPSPMYSDEMRRQAVKRSVDGMNYRRIACHLGVDHKTVINWVNVVCGLIAYSHQPKKPSLHLVGDTEFAILIQN